MDVFLDTDVQNAKYFIEVKTVTVGYSLHGRKNQLT